MNDIRFRAWTGKKYFYQDDQYLGSFIRRACMAITQDHDPESWGHEHESYLPNGGDIEEYFDQWTGLSDKNGKWIYFGDIIQHDNGFSTTVEKKRSSLRLQGPSPTEVEYIGFLHPSSLERGIVIGSVRER